MSNRAFSLAGRAALYWLGMLVVIFSLGALRQLLLEPAIGALPAHQIGSFAAIIVVALFARRFVARTAVSPRAALLVGIFWVALTATFEFGFFHFVVGRPWAVLTADYNLLEGRLMGLLMLTTLAAPWVFSLLSREYPAASAA